MRSCVEYLVVRYPAPIALPTVTKIWRIHRLPSAKSARVAERRRSRNAPLRSRAKTYVTKARRSITADDLEAAEQATKEAVVALDKAAQKGVLHRGNASRRKSRLMRLLHQAKNA